MRGVMRLAALGTRRGAILRASGRGAQEKGKSPSLDDLPRKVRDAVTARFPEARLTSVGKETVGKDVVWDIELTQKGRKYEMDIKEDGTVLEVEKEVFLKEWPKDVRKAFQA